MVAPRLHYYVRHFSVLDVVVLTLLGIRAVFTEMFASLHCSGTPREADVRKHTGNYSHVRPCWTAIQKGGAVYDLNIVKEVRHIAPHSCLSHLGAVLQIAQRCTKP